MNEKDITNAVKEHLKAATKDNIAIRMFGKSRTYPSRFTAEVVKKMEEEAAKKLEEGCV